MNHSFFPTVSLKPKFSKAGTLIVEAVAVRALEPSRGPIEGGTFVNVTGSGFSPRAALLGYLSWCVIWWPFPFPLGFGVSAGVADSVGIVAGAGEAVDVESGG